MANNAAIEFFQFNYWNKHWTDTTYYAVCVIRPEWKVPQYFILGDQRSFQRLMSQQQNSLKALYQQVWQPIDKLLQGVQQVFYAPTGLLHRLAFDALPNSEGKSLFDRYTLHRLNSTKQIGSDKNTLSSNTKLEHNWTAVLLGGIDYKTKYTDRKDYRISTVENQVKLPSTRDIDKKQRSISVKGIDSLPGTRAEVKYIASLLTPFLKTRILTDTNASEWAIKRLSNQSPDLLVIATHGYYFADPNLRQSSILNDDTPFYTNAENPLLRSGLLLAGSEPAFTYDIEPRFGQEDGILTAYELADLNLDNTKLCVLSACESGLGDIRSTEGVYGLQRALKIAGVKKVILSLWKVSDRATYELMKLMYTEWKSGKTLHESLTNAQKNVRQSNPLVKDWAGFVLIE